MPRKLPESLKAHQFKKGEAKAGKKKVTKPAKKQQKAVDNRSRQGPIQVRV